MDVSDTVGSDPDGLSQRTGSREEHVSQTQFRLSPARDAPDTALSGRCRYRRRERYGFGDIQVANIIEGIVIEAS